MNLASAFAESTRLNGEKCALFWGDARFSYLELLDQTLCTAARLRQEFDVRPGDRVGLWLKNCPGFIPCFFGILHTGAVAVPINNFLKPDEVNHILADAGIDLVIADAELASHLPALTAVRSHLRLLVLDQVCLPVRVETLRAGSAWSEDYASFNPFNSFNCSDPAASPALPPSSALAVLIYTSGTTGRPKGAMLSHANLLSNVESCRLALRTDATDRFAVMLPLFHSYMLTVGLLLPLLNGGSVVLMKSLHPARSALQEILLRQVTVLPAIPQFYRAMVGADLPAALPLRLCVSGAAPLPAQILKEFEAKFRIPLIEGYGLSEASPVVTKNPLDGQRKAGSVGIPVPNVEVSIQDDSGGQLPPGNTGEVCVRGPNVMLGYWNRPEEAAAVMRKGWLLTGDIGHRDADGFFYITDRKKDMLLVNGMNVYPREIEEVLYQLPQVREAAVIGQPDPRKGEQPIAFVAARDGVLFHERAIFDFLRQKLADYKVPRRIITLPALPRTATGKVLKTKLREMAQAAALKDRNPKAEIRKKPEIRNPN